MAKTGYFKSLEPKKKLEVPVVPVVPVVPLTKNVFPIPKWGQRQRTHKEMYGLPHKPISAIVRNKK